MQSLNMPIGDLFSKDACYCFLAGSGISIDAPSNLPTGYQFTRSLLHDILPPDFVNVILPFTDPGRQEKKAEGHFLRFEQLMGFLQESVDPELHVLDCFADSTQPNFNHFFLTSLIEKGCPVFTTNFDSLIEYALLQLGVNKSQITPVIHRSAWETDPTPGFSVYKLHGSLVDCCSGLEARSSVQATIGRIAQQKRGETFVLESWKMARLRRELCAHDLVICGYSGLDDFDIIPALKSVKSGKRLIWVSHAEQTPVNNALVQCPSDKFTAHKTNDLSRMEPQPRSLFETMVSAGVRHASSLFNVHVNTRALLAFLSQHWGLTRATRGPTFDATLRPTPKQVTKLELNEAYRWLLLGNIWFTVGDLKQALFAYKKALSSNQQAPSGLSQ